MWLINVQEILSNLYKMPSKKNKILFLIRNSTCRNTMNERSVIDLLKKSYMITTFDPAKESFKRASHSFNSSSMIVGQSSASLANILFASQKITFITWKYNGPQQNKSLMKELFSILGHTLIELDATPIMIKGRGLDWQMLHITQANLYISPDTVLSALNEKK
jgi:capsular polysaccharide biosynthesis protein